MEYLHFVAIIYMGGSGGYSGLSLVMHVFDTWEIYKQQLTPDQTYCVSQNNNNTTVFLKTYFSFHCFETHCDIE